jgi:uncharacterized Zn finger protein (UPF0148 family)
MSDLTTTTRKITTEEIRRAEELLGKKMLPYDCESCGVVFLATKKSKTCSSRCRQAAYLDRKALDMVVPKPDSDEQKSREKLETTLKTILHD